MIVKTIFQRRQPFLTARWHIQTRVFVQLIYGPIGQTWVSERDWKILDIISHELPVSTERLSLYTSQVTHQAGAVGWWDGGSGGLMVSELD